MPTDTDRLRRLAAYADIVGAADFPIGEWAGGDTDEHGVIHMPWFDYSGEVLAFTRELSTLGWVYPFDWPSWAQTPAGERYLREPDAVADATEADLGKILTTVVRGDRFNEGMLAEAFRRGIILAVVRRAEALLGTQAEHQTGRP